MRVKTTAALTAEAARQALAAATPQQTTSWCG